MPSPIQIVLGDNAIRTPFVDAQTHEVPVARIGPSGHIWTWRATAQLPTLEQCDAFLDRRTRVHRGLQFIPRMLILSVPISEEADIRINLVSSSQGEMIAHTKHLRHWKALPESMAQPCCSLEGPALEPGGWVSVLGNSRLRRSKGYKNAGTMAATMQLSALFELWTPHARPMQIKVVHGTPLRPPDLPDVPAPPSLIAHTPSKMG